MGKVMLQEILENTPKIALKFQNLTSETQLDEVIEMASASAEGCTLVVPKPCCALGHQVFLSILLLGRHLKKKKVEVVGKILEVNPVDENQVEVRIQFTQFVKEEWQTVMGIFSDRQKQVSDVIEILKTPKV